MSTQQLPVEYVERTVEGGIPIRFPRAVSTQDVINPDQLAAHQGQLVTGGEWTAPVVDQTSNLGPDHVQVDQTTAPDRSSLGIVRDEYKVDQQPAPRIQRALKAITGFITGPTEGMKEHTLVVPIERPVERPPLSPSHPGVRFGENVVRGARFHKGEDGREVTTHLLASGRPGPRLVSTSLKVPNATTIGLANLGGNKAALDRIVDPAGRYPQPWQNQR